MPVPTLLTALDDAAFDAAYPPWIQRFSGRFSTPVGVARRAAEMFRESGARRVLDVGAGVGKFVLAACACVPAIVFVGIEQRADLIEIARRVRFEQRIPNALFLKGDATSASWAPYDGFYFFNPLAENLFALEERIDNRVELSEARFMREVLRIEQALRDARLGTLVVTYHGSSTRMPACYELRASERAGSDCLRLWVKKWETDDGSFFVEVNDSIVWHGPSGGAA